MAKAKKTAPAASKIETHQITSREQWLALRMQDVTASAAPALLGIHKYLTAFELYQEKRGERADVIETPPMRRGTLLEPVAIRVLRDENPEIKFSEPNIYLRDPASRLGATPDLYASFPDGSFGVVQIKSVAEPVFRSQWKGQIDGDPEAIEPPLWIVVQAIIEAALAEGSLGGLKKPIRAFVAPLVVGFGLDCPLIEIPLDNNAPRVLANIKKASLDFWQKVKENTPPEFDYEKDGEAISALYNVPKAATIDLSRDNRIGPAIDELLAVKGVLKDAKATEETLKNEIKAKLDGHEAAYVPGYGLTCKVQSRAEYVAKATSYPVLRASKK